MTTSAASFLLPLLAFTSVVEDGALSLEIERPEPSNPPTVAQQIVLIVRALTPVAPFETIVQTGREGLWTPKPDWSAWKTLEALELQPLDPPAVVRRGEQVVHEWRAVFWPNLPGRHELPPLPVRFRATGRDDVPIALTAPSQMVEIAALLAEAGGAEAKPKPPAPMLAAQLRIPRWIQICLILVAWLAARLIYRRMRANREAAHREFLEGPPSEDFAASAGRVQTPAELRQTLERFLGEHFDLEAAGLSPDTARTHDRLPTATADALAPLLEALDAQIYTSNPGELDASLRARVVQFIRQHRS